MMASSVSSGTSEGTLRAMEEESESPEECPMCHRILDDPLYFYEGHPNGAEQEVVSLTHPQLCLVKGEEKKLRVDESRPLVKLTQYSVYDKYGHLCPFHTGLIQENALLYVSGYLKAIYEENPLAEGGVPTKDIGPINKWNIMDYDGGHALVVLSTAYADYILITPSTQYESFVAPLERHINWSEKILNVLEKNINQQHATTYQDLLETLSELSTNPEELVQSQAAFVIEWIRGLRSSPLRRKKLLATPCMKEIVRRFGGRRGKKRTNTTTTPPQLHAQQQVNMDPQSSQPSTSQAPPRRFSPPLHQLCTELQPNQPPGEDQGPSGSGSSN